MAREAQQQCAKPPKAEKAIVARRGDAHVGPESFQHRRRAFVRDNEAKQDVGVSADVFGRRMDGNIDAMFETAKAERRRP